MSAAHVVCAPDKFRGSLSADEAAAAMAEGARRAGRDAILHPLADGGEGTMEILVRARGGERIVVTASDALGRPRPATIALLGDGTAVVEAAEAIGLAHLRPDERDVLHASSAGLGELLLAALDAGADRLLVCLGGSATVDGGLGMLRVLGVGLRDGDGAQLVGSGADLARLVAIDAARLDPRLRSASLVLALDVSSPLSGPEGAAAVFGPQKGASADEVRLLDHGLVHLGTFFGAAAAIPGAGAAGGLGAALAWLGATPRVGADLVIEETRLAESLAGAALLLTGEGRVDAQTATGKTAARAVAAAVAAGVPAAVIAGAVDAGAEEALYALGARAVVAASRGPATLGEALGDAAANVTALARALAGLLPRS